MWQIDKDKDGKVTRTKLFGVVVRTACAAIHRTLTSPVCAAHGRGQANEPLVGFYRFVDSGVGTQKFRFSCVPPLVALCVWTHGIDMTSDAEAAPGVALQGASGDVARFHAHLMPFSIEYDGPAPVDTYMVLTAPPKIAGGEAKSDAVVHPDDTYELESTFRGRRIHGTRIRFPDSYALGLFQMQRNEARPSQEEEHEAVKRAREQPPKRVQTTAPPAPVRGSRFTLDDDDDEDEDSHTAGDADVEALYGEQSEPADDDAGDQGPSEARAVTPAEPSMALKETAHLGDSIWVWGADGPVDRGDDPFVRTCGEWIHVVAPAVSGSNSPQTTNATFSFIVPELRNCV